MEIYIEEEYRKQGVATTLVQYAIDYAKSQSAKVISLGTGTENIVMTNLVEKMGFELYRQEYEKLL